MKRGDELLVDGQGGDQGTIAGSNIASGLRRYSFWSSSRCNVRDALQLLGCAARRIVRSAAPREVCHGSVVGDLGSVDDGCQGASDAPTLSILRRLLEQPHPAARSLGPSDAHTEETEKSGIEHVAVSWENPRTGGPSPLANRPTDDVTLPSRCRRPLCGSDVIRLGECRHENPINKGPF